MGRFWTDEEVDLLYKLYPNYTDMDKVNDAFPDRTWAAVQQKASTEGLTSDFQISDEVRLYRAAKCWKGMIGEDRCQPAEETPTSEDIAWAAGIYEGEGYCQPPHLGISITQKDRWMLERLRSLFGGSIGEKSNGKNDTTYYRWRLSGSRAHGFAMTIYSYLSPRRKKPIKKCLVRAKNKKKWADNIIKEYEEG